jgi:hypothetical protein
MNIILTSFRDSNNWKGTKCSIARWQPDWSNMPEFPVNVKPVLDGKVLGDWLIPSEYRTKYNIILKRKESELIDFFSKFETDEPLILCCWCTLERQHRNRLLCHRILLGYWIEEHFNYARVIYADGADKSIWQR